MKIGQSIRLSCFNSNRLFSVFVLFMFLSLFFIAISSTVTAITTRSGVLGSDDFIENPDDDPVGDDDGDNMWGSDGEVDLVDPNGDGDPDGTEDIPDDPEEELEVQIEDVEEEHGEDDQEDEDEDENDDEDNNDNEGTAGGDEDEEADEEADEEEPTNDDQDGDEEDDIPVETPENNNNQQETNQNNAETKENEYDDNVDYSDEVNKETIIELTDEPDVDLYVTLNIKGKLYFLVDFDKNGEIDTLYDPDYELSSDLEQTADHKYLIDVDDDGEWDYIYDYALGEITIIGDDNNQADASSSSEIIPVYVIAAVATFAIVVLGYWVYHDQKRLY